jgi:hypothetical protein
VLGEKWAAAQAGHEEAPLGGSVGIPMLHEDRRGHGERCRSGNLGLRSGS